MPYYKMDFSKTNWEDLKIGDEIFVYDFGPYRSHFSSKRDGRNEKYGGYQYEIVGFTKHMIIFDNCNYHLKVAKNSKDSTWRLYE
tara:strand:- start:41 stop:295 length:255 start_codon:yes stop_codon:yes gene_type:complete